MERPLTLGRIFLFWAPLASTWLMMALEGPFLSAVIARLDEPKYNLAAYGVSFAVAILIEAPIIMILSAATALVDDRRSFRKLRNFTFATNVVLTAVMLLLLFTPAWELIARKAIGLPEPVAELTWLALAIMLPWPGAIGYRRFYQGLMIRNDQTRRVAYGTLVRLGTMSTTALGLFLFSEIPGACVGASALSAGVCVEALVSRWMARDAVRAVAEGDEREVAPHELLTYRRIFDFYYPLALTSTISLAAHPMVTFFMGRAPYALESLAVLPVVNALVFVFRAIGLSYQEVGIAMLARDERNHRQVARFASILGACSTAVLATIAFTSLARIWFEDVSGLAPQLSGFAVLPLRILVAIPALSVLLSVQRAVLVHVRDTRPINRGAMVEVAGILVMLLLTVHGLQWVGATAAAASFVVGRVADNLYLTPACKRSGVLAGEERPAPSP